jgi:hypothetical protein
MYLHKEIQIQHLVHVDHNDIAVHLTTIDCEGFQEVLYIQCSVWDG